MASYYHNGKRRLMARVTNATASKTQTTPTDTRGMKSIAFQQIVSSLTGTNPTWDGKIQGSHDKSTWFDLGVSFTQATAATAEHKTPSTDTPLPRWIRYVGTAGGTVTDADVDVFCLYSRLGDGSMAPTKSALTTPTGAVS